MDANPNRSSILSFEEARKLVEAEAAKLRPSGRELLDLLDASGRVLAEPLSADRDFPPFNRAARDGYALRAADLHDVPATLEVIGEVRAGGAVARFDVKPRQAAAIMTGAPVPSGFDSLVMVEHTCAEGNRVQVLNSVQSGANIVPQGSEAQRGSRLLAPGTRLGPAAIAIAASVGRSRVLVHSKPRIAVLATGDEIVDVDAPPGPSQVRNSNSYSLAAQIIQAGAESMLLPIAPDEPERLRELISDGLDADLLLLSGGVSMGKYDLVEQVLVGEFKAEFFFTGAQIQPGKPVVFGRLPSPAALGTYTYFFGLPGNPVSTMVTFELFVRPVVDALCGISARPLQFLHARLKSEIKTKTGLKRFLPATLSGELEHAEVELVPWQGSGDIAATARANCYVVVPPDREYISAGEWVPVLLP